MDNPPSLEGWEYTDADGRRWRYVRTIPTISVPTESPAETPQTAPVPWWGWLCVVALLCLWGAFLLHPWAWRLWWAPLRWPAEVLWVAGWIATPLWLLSACIVGLGDALRY